MLSTDRGQVQTLKRKKTISAAKTRSLALPGNKKQMHSRSIILPDQLRIWVWDWFRAGPWAAKCGLHMPPGISLHSTSATIYKAIVSWNRKWKRLCTFITWCSGLTVVRQCRKWVVYDLGCDYFRIGKCGRFYEEIQSLTTIFTKYTLTVKTCITLWNYVRSWAHLGWLENLKESEKKCKFHLRNSRHSDKTLTEKRPSYTTLTWTSAAITASQSEFYRNTRLAGFMFYCFQSVKNQEKILPSDLFLREVQNRSTWSAQ